MKLNHTDVVLNFEGEEMKELVGPEEVRDLTFRSLAVTALHTVAKDEHLGAEDKALGFAISAKFFRGKFVNLTVDEAAFIKRRGGVILNPMPFGRLSEWLEGKPQVVATDEGDDEDGPESPAL